MTPLEATQVARVVAALCPAQKMDQDTPAAWALVLDDIRYEDAELAVKNLGKRQTFISPAEIRTEVRAFRSKRIAQAGDLTPPPNLDEAATRAWLGEAKRRIGNGEPADQVNYQLPPSARRRNLAELGRAGKDVA